MATYDEMMAKSRELHAAGKLDDAKRVAQIALKLRSATPPEPKGNWFQRNILPDDDPATFNAGEKTAAMLNKAGEAMTLGVIGDEADARVKSWLPGGGTYDEELTKNRDRETAFREAHPGLSLGAELAGAVAPVALSRGKLGVNPAALGNSLGRRMALGAGLGASGGGVYGFMEGEGLDDRLDQAKFGSTLGGIAGGVLPVLGAGVQKVADTRKGKEYLRGLVKTAPSTASLRAEGKALYDQVDNAGVRIRPDVVKSHMDDIQNYLRGEGVHYTGAEKVYPSSTAILQSTGDVAKGSNTVPFKEMDMFRRFTGAAAGANLKNKADTRVATGVLERLDDFVQNLKPGDLDAGDIDALKTALPKAREVWARMSKSQLVDDAIENAADYRTGAASGLRAQFQRIVKNDKLSRGFSDAEKAALRRVVNGNILEQFVNYAGSGLGMIAQSAVGGLAGSWPGFLAGTATGAAARKASEAIVNRNAEIARALVAKGGSINLPVASDTSRRLTEALLRRSAVTGAD